VAVWLPRLMFLLVPFFASLVSRVRRVPIRPYPQHLIFALHVHAAWFGFTWWRAARDVAIVLRIDWLMLVTSVLVVLLPQVVAAGDGIVRAHAQSLPSLPQTNASRAPSDP
jgi:hypothetical protein